jgi:hypothetical protein
MPLLSATALSLLALNVPLTGQGTCPTADEVSVALTELHADLRAEDGDRFEIVPAGGAVLVRWQRAGATVVEKVLAAQGCAQRANTAALVIAGWLAPVRGTDLALPEPPPPTPTPTPVRWEWTAGALGAWSNDLSPGALLTVGRALGRNGFLSAGLLGVAAHDLALAEGHVRWARAGALFEGGARVPMGAAAWLEAGGALWLAASRVGGRFLVDETSTSFQPALAADLRLRLGRAPIRPWVGFTVAIWLRPQTVFLRESDLTQTLPRGELLAGVGVFFGGP